MSTIGRPSCYTPEIAARICSELVLGKTLTAICQQEGFPCRQTVLAWCSQHPSFLTDYVCAREAGVDAQVDEMAVIAADKKRDPNCRRVEIDAIKWRASKMVPRKYGDKLELSGQVDVTHTIADSIREARVKRMQVERAKELT